MKKIIRPLIGLFFIFILIYMYQVNTPQYIVSSYWDHLSNNRYEEAEKLTSEAIFDSRDSRNLNINAIDKVFLERTSLNHKETQINKNESTVSGVMSFPDIFYALDSEEDLEDALKNAPIIQKEYTFNLEKSNDGWKITKFNIGGN